MLAAVGPPGDFIQMIYVQAYNTAGRVRKLCVARYD